jgi:energy-coupling factor transport system permease protein
MRRYEPLRPVPGAFLADANPVAKLGAAIVLMTALFLSIDPVTPAVALVALLAAVPLTGLPARALPARLWPILVAAAAIAILNTVFAADQRGSLVAIGPLSFGADAMFAGLALGLRILAIALTGILALASTDPTDLADALQLQLRVSPRFAVGTLAAVRLIPILAAEWQILGLARRARGVAAGRNPVAAVRIFLGQLLSLLVAALRRGTRLATAMDARGFGSRPCRTVARDQRMRRADWGLLLASVVVAAAAVGASLSFGTWRFLFG